MLIEHCVKDVDGALRIFRMVSGAIANQQAESVPTGLADHIAPANIGVAIVRAEDKVCPWIIALIEQVHRFTEQFSISHW
ncbi:hypothetical protein GCM10011585_32100 [Edaphobacter dinghuensis]|uniref:Uncharacterized protein n=1 Tax=Edaphobacter dinghuensis TaxID=1560005 RepID=A0A917HNX7_9BACT|nr:hypothetical protein GCM10011585_32100 [Edaphobacter dinghuensis]